MLSALYVKEICVFALSEKVTRISLSSNLYWSVSESVLVSVQTYIGRTTPFSECGVKRMYMRGLCVMFCAGRLGAELVVFSGERMGMRGYFFSPLMREGFCLTKSAQFFVAPAEAERRGEEVRKWWQRAAARPSVASSSRGI